MFLISLASVHALCKLYSFDLRYYNISIHRLEHRNNYAHEAMNLQVQLHMLLSERLQQQVIWGRFVNASGGEGRNISCDLHMEHLNR
jgi:L1 cell adhesion molecule like protein